MNKKYTLILVGIVVLGVGVVSVAFVFAEQARTESVQLFGEENTKVLYSTLDETGKNAELKSLDFGVFKDTEVLKEDQDVVSQKVFLSPDRELIAVTVQSAGDYKISTYITDSGGNIVVSPRPGSFKSWSPDSKKVLLYLSIETTGKDRQIYYLDLDSNYYDSGLPNGVINADIFPKDGSIAYSVTEQGADKSNIYIKNKQGEDKLLIKGENNILAWVRWSPDSNKIAFMKSDLGIRPGKQNIWIADVNSGKLEKISNIIWSYPPVWSPDGTKIAFSDDGNILEYNVQQKELKNITNFTSKSVKHPSYSADGQTIVFSDGKQIWSSRNGEVRQLTEGVQPKDYPILPQ